jgi:predicted CXXCH cytochrome family protein
MNPEPAPPSAPPRLRWTQWAVLFAALAAGVVYLFVAGVFDRPNLTSESTSDPPLAELSSPFLNTRSGVKYVGDKVCAGCHGKLTRAYHGHPMGRSANMPGDGLERIPDTIQADNLRLSVQWQGKQLIHRVSYLDEKGKPLAGVPSAQAAIAFVLGSGTQGRAYVVDHDGYLYQSPLSWYSRIKKWDLSPGYQHNFLHFNRPITLRCLFCHGDGAHAVEGTVNRYQSPLVLRAIGCERCHGPGELHVAARQRGDDLGAVDPTIVNPRHLTPALREAVCQQCHLQGEAAIDRRGRSLEVYRPGMPLSAFVSVFVKRPQWADNYKAVSHPEQMQVSKCFTASKGKLGCTSCHDPHQEPGPAQRRSYFRAACLKCHQEKDCHLSLAERQAKDKDDSCIACHMPRAAASDISHAAITDHRILSQPDQPPAFHAVPPSEKEMPLVCFFEDKKPGTDPELDRDLGIALMKIAKSSGNQPAAQGIAQGALALLDRAVQRAPHDAAAWQARGMAQSKLGLWRSALESLDRALELAPDNERTLNEAAHVAAASQQPELTLKYARRLTELDPWETDYPAILAQAHLARRDWTEAAAAARKALALDPGNIPARTVLIRALVRQRDRKTAAVEFERLMALRPPNAEELRRQYEELGP